MTDEIDDTDTRIARIYSAVWLRLQRAREVEERHPDSATAIAVRREAEAILGAIEEIAPGVGAVDRG